MYQWYANELNYCLLQPQFSKAVTQGDTIGWNDWMKKDDFPDVLDPDLSPRGKEPEELNESYYYFMVAYYYYILS